MTAPKPLTPTEAAHPFIALLLFAQTELKRVFKGYTVEIREPKETELKPLQVWITLPDIENPNEGRVGGAEEVPLSLPVSVTVLYTPSDDQFHYLRVILKRLAFLRALERISQKAVRDYGLIAYPDGESTFVTEGFIASATLLTVEYREPTAEE